MASVEQNDLVRLDPKGPFWERFYTVSSLVVVGTQNEDGSANLAPKHLTTPLSWTNFFGFVCTPHHKTYENAVRTGAYTVSFPRPSQVVLASLTASPREEAPEENEQKPILEELPTLPAAEIDGTFLKDAYLFLECELERDVADLGDNNLLIGKIKAVHVSKVALRLSEREDEDVIRDSPLLAYLPPNRYTIIDSSNAFPFPAGFHR